MNAKRTSPLVKNFLFSLIILGGLFFASVQLSLAQPDGYVIQEIRFTHDSADEVVLVWGVDGWETVVEEKRPSGTWLDNNIMHTPMQKQSDTFVTSVNVPPESTIDFGFLATETGNGETISTWHADENGDYHRLVTPNEAIEISDLQTSNLSRFTPWLISSVGLILAVLFGRKNHFSLVDQPLTIQLKLTNAFVKKSAITLSVINVVILAGMWGFIRYAQTSGISYEEMPAWARMGLVQFNLATENIFASWYSAILLLLVSVTCLICFAGDQQHLQEKRPLTLSYGWLFLALAFLTLSADELGSWHEAIGLLPFVGGSGWVRVLAIPIGVVALFIAAFVWFHLRQRRLTFWLMGLGLGLYIINPFMELAEMALLGAAETAGAMQRHDFLVWLEEGAEIFGTLSFLIASIVYVSQTGAIRINFRLKTAVILTTILTILLIVGQQITAVILQNIERGDTGNPLNWYPSILALFVALIAFYLAHNQSEKTAVFIITALFFTTLSFYYGINIRGWLFGLDMGRLIVHGGLITTAVFITYTLTQTSQLGWQKAGAILWLTLFILSIYQAPPAVRWADIAVTAVFLPLLLPRLNSN